MENGHNGRGVVGGCCGSWGRVRGFIQPCLLLLLQQRPSHGYELMERLSEKEDDPEVEPALVYRTLRQLEEDGLVRSSWDTAGGGPARRLYELTPGGVDHLHAWAVDIGHMRRRLERFLTEYDALISKQLSE